MSDGDNPYRPDTTLGMLTQLARAVRRWEWLQRKPEFGGPPLAPDPPQLEGRAEPKPSPANPNGPAGYDALVDEMEEMRRAVPQAVTSRWKAAETLASRAKGRTPKTQTDSKRDWLISKHEAKYPGEWESG
jgi:hypothetical protein